MTKQTRSNQESNKARAFSDLQIMQMLTGHLLGSGLICIGLIFLIWLVSLALHFLNSIHPFKEEARTVLHGVEVYSLALDTMVCAIVFCAGALRFCRIVLRSSE